MNVSEAVEQNRQFWADVEQMPPEVADRYLALAEQTPDFQESQRGNADLEDVAGKIALLALRASEELNTDPCQEKGTSEARVDSDAEEDTVCTPLLSETYEYETKIDEGAKSLYDKYAAIKRETKRQIAGLTNKRAAKIQRHEKKEINKLFVNYETEDGERKLAHIAEDPAIFAVQMYDLTCAGRGEVEGMDAEVSKQLARDMLFSAEHYVADNADRLSESKDFTQKLLIAYAYDARVQDRNFIPPTGHILRGYFTNIRNSEQAVNRLEALFDSLLDLYETPSYLAASSELFTMLPSIFDQVPLIKFMTLAIYGGADDETLQRLTVLDQLIALPHTSNTAGNITKPNVILRNQKLAEKLVSQADKKSATQEFCRTHPNGQQIIDQRLEDLLVYRNASQPETVEASGLDYRTYWQNFAIEHPDSLITKTLLINPSTMMLRYTGVLGAATTNPNVLTLPFSDSFVIDIVAPAGVTAQEKREFILATRAQFDSRRDYYIKLAEEIKSSAGTLLGKSFGETIINIAEGEHKYSAIRPRSLFDDVITPPTQDFDIVGLRTEKPLPGLEDIKSAIDEKKVRFVPKRGIEVHITDSETKNSGLSKIVFRAVGAKHLTVKATIHGRERTFQIKNYEFFDNAGQPLDSSLIDEDHTFKSYFLNTLSKWMCRPAVETSEGTVQEGKDGPVKGGFFAYLRIREQDGYKFRRDDVQWNLCATEQSEDLDLISEKRSLNDPRGVGRNSTYVSISSDDGDHLPPLKVYL